MNSTGSNMVHSIMVIYAKIKTYDIYIYVCIHSAAAAAAVALCYRTAACCAVAMLLAASAAIPHDTPAT